MSNAGEFYDGLADTYDDMFSDWNASIARQAEIFDDILDDGRHEVLDCSCGTGTQSIGLAARGHRVTAADLSPASVARAGREARARGAALATVVSDMRSLPFAPSTFDTVLCIDNSLCHLLTEDDVVAALGELRRVLRAGGRLVLSVRDYDGLRGTRPNRTLPQLATRETERCVTFQLWHWHADGQRYDFEHFQVHGRGDSWRVGRRESTLWALTRAEISRMAGLAGFTAVAWRDPGETGFYQPIVTAS